HLRSLSLSSTKVSDAGMQRVAKLKQLRNLSLASCVHLSDAGMRHLTSLKHLKGLNLYKTNVTDVGLAVVYESRNLQKSLRRLDTGYSKISDNGLRRAKQAMPVCNIYDGYRE
ncbi:MAG: ribonuclease inhibitor, partial [Planctomycetota bacterium]|nr:ribonuclease inhibitor [Planctomycetota bacterium]